SRSALPPARADQGRQSRAGPRGAGSPPPRRRMARRAEAGGRLAVRPCRRRGGRAARCTRRAICAAARMTPPLALDAGLALLVLAVAAWTIAARRTFGSVIGFVTYGLLLALAWVRLSAVGVALTGAAVCGGRARRAPLAP